MVGRERLGLPRNPTLESPDRLEHWSLNAFHSLGGIVKDAAAADRKALSNQASAPLTHLECRNPGLRVGDGFVEVEGGAGDGGPEGFTFEVLGALFLEEGL